MSIDRGSGKLTLSDDRIITGTYKMIELPRNLYELQFYPDVDDFSIITPDVTDFKDVQGRWKVKDIGVSNRKVEGSIITIICKAKYI